LLTFWGDAKKLRENCLFLFSLTTKPRYQINHDHPSQNPLSHYVHVQSEAKLKLGYRKEAEGSPKRSSLMSGTHEVNISDEFSLFLSFAEKERRDKFIFPIYTLFKTTKSSAISTHDAPVPCATCRGHSHFLRSFFISPFGANSRAARRTNSKKLRNPRFFFVFLPPWLKAAFPLR
jgi:hypothetical protein